MTKIKKFQHKRHNYPSLREELENTPVDNIHNVLKPYREWPFIRGDLYHWITVLNRFDDILAEITEKYELHSLQKTEFSPDTQKTLVAILRFSRQLMENCVNRSLYSSVEYLDCLLYTSDPEVLEATLRVLVRSAPRWSYHRDIKANLAVFSTRLMIIASPWNLKKDIVPFIDQNESSDVAAHTNEFKLLVSSRTTSVLQRHAGNIHYQFFRTAEDIKRMEKEREVNEEERGIGMGVAGATSSRSQQSKKQQHGHSPASSIAEGLVSIDEPIDKLCSDATVSIHMQMEQAFSKLVAKYKVSSAHHYELRHRIYVALAFARGDSQLRFLLLRARINAATVLSQLMTEQEFKNMFLSREPNFTSDIITLLQPEVHAPLSLQTTVLLALEGLLKQRREVSGAYVSLNASANHGVLMFILRKALSTADEPPAFPYEFMSALYGFLTSMTTTMNGGQLLVSAGAVPVFVSALKQTHPQHLRGVGRVARLLWSIISSVNSAFAAFCGANGIVALVQRMSAEVLNAVALGEANPEVANDLSSPVKMPPFSEYPQQVYRRREALPAENIYLLKELFKLLCNLMQQPSYQDRLRNLVETDLPETLRIVVTHPGVFGNNIYGPAISIAATLVHNEPTSLPILQEARLPQALIESLEKHIPYNADVLINIPSVIGAFCLNDTGMEQIRNSSVVEMSLHVFADPQFIRVLQEGDVPGLFGAGLDEFMRHFPAVKDSIMDIIIKMVKDIVAIASKRSPLLEYNPGNTFLLRSDKEDSLKAYHDDFYGMMVESMSTFLEGLFEQRAHCELFLEKGGWDLVVQTVRSPILPFAFVKSRAFQSLNGLSSLLLETSQADVFKALFLELKRCLDLPGIVGGSFEDDKSDRDSVDAYLALSDPTALSEEQYSVVQEQIHNSVSTTGAIALITYLINGSGGGSLGMCIKDYKDIAKPEEFIALISRVCSSYTRGIQKAVAAEHMLSLLPEPSEEKKGSEKTEKSKGKEPEPSFASTEQSQRMDIDSTEAAATNSYVRTNYHNLAEVAIAYTLEAGDFIECISNSIGLENKPAKDKKKSESYDIGAAMSNELNSFVERMLKLCQNAEHTTVGAKLLDQSLVTLMKSLVFARNRIYVKLRIFTGFVEQGGLDDFCKLLETTWEWAETVPRKEDEEGLAGETTDAGKSTDSQTRIYKILENVLESMLSILSFMLDSEPIVECPDFTALCHDHIAHRAWFNPGALVTSIRLKALPVLQKIWKSPLLVQANTNVMQSFIGCIGPILNSTREVLTPAMGSSSRPHFSSLLGRHRSAHGNRRASGSQTPIPLLGRALDPAGRGPQRPLFIDSLDAVLNDTGSGDSLDDSDPLQRLRMTAFNMLGEADNSLGDAEGESGSRPAETDTTSHEQQGSSNDQPDAAAASAEDDAEDTGSEDHDSEATDSDEDSDELDDVLDEEDEQLPSNAEPMVVDSSEHRDSNAEASAGTSSQTQGKKKASSQHGTEPYSSHEWREARAAEDDKQRQQINKLRDEFHDSIVPRVIEVVDEFKDKAVFQMRSVLKLVLRKNHSGPAVHMLLNAFIPLLDSATASSNGEDKAADERLAAHAHLWAVLLSNVQLLDEIHPHAKKLGPHLLQALEVASHRADKSPAWATALLLVIELLLQRDCKPPHTTVEKKEEHYRIAKRGLTKLPPSSTSLGNEAIPGPSSTNPHGVSFGSALDGDLISRIFESTPASEPAGSAFEPIMSNDENSSSGEPEMAEDGGAHAASGGAERAQFEPVFAVEERSELQRLAAQFFSLPMPHYAPPLLNALLRLIVILTRNPDFAVEFLDSGRLANVVRVMRTLSPGDMPSTTAAISKEKTPTGLVNALMAIPKEKQTELRQERTLVMYVLRHVIESKPVLRLVMENLIQGWFEGPHFSSTDANNYVRGTLAYAMRDSELYTQVTTERCFMPTYNDEMKASWMALAWRSAKLVDEEEVNRYEDLPIEDTHRDDHTSKKTADAESTSDSVDPAIKTESDEKEAKDENGAIKEFEDYLSEKMKKKGYEPYELDLESEKLACRVVEFLVEEVLSLRPSVGNAPLISRSATTNTSQTQSTPSKLHSSSHVALSSAALGGTAASASASSSDNTDTIAYRCFLMQCLSELIASFPFALRSIFIARSNGVSQLLSPRKDKGKGKAPQSGDDNSYGQQQQQQQQQHLLRVRSPLISHLVHDLIVREAVTSSKVAPKKKSKAELAALGTELDQVLDIANQQIEIVRGHLSRSVTFWATALLSTICVRHQESWSTTAARNASRDGNKTSEQTARIAANNEVTIESLAGNYDAALLATRNLVLDHIVRAFRECLSATASGVVGGTDIIYARLTSLAHLTYKLVIARPINHGQLSGGSRSQTSSDKDKESTNILKKMFLERGILDFLTAASSRLNLNHPQSRDMLNLFLRPIEYLSKTAVKISRDAVLDAWEKSGQEKMPHATGQRSFNLDLLDDDGVPADEDEDIPPDLYENSALGLHQNQRTAAGHGADEQYDEDAMMDDIYEEELYDDGNSSLSDFDTEDELDDDAIVDEDPEGVVVGSDDDEGAMTMDTIMRGRDGDEEDDDDDDGSEDDDEDDSDDSDDMDEDDEGDNDDDDEEMEIHIGRGAGGSGSDAAELGNSFGFSIRNALRLLDGGNEMDNVMHEEEEQIMDEENEGAEFYGSDLEGEVVMTDDDDEADEHPAAASHDPEDGHWSSDLSDSDMDGIQVIPLSGFHHNNYPHNHAFQGNPPRLTVRSRPSSASGGNQLADPGSAGAGDATVRIAEISHVAEHPDDNANDHSSSEGESDESDDEADSFADDIPASFELVVDDEGMFRPVPQQSHLSDFIVGMLSGRLTGGRDGITVGGQRPTSIPSLSQNRPLAISNGISSTNINLGNTLFSQSGHTPIGVGLPRMPNMMRSGVSIGGANGPAHDMAHPMVEQGNSGGSNNGGGRQDRNERNTLQSRAERVSRSALHGPTQTTPDDVYQLGQLLATRLSNALSNGRRPAYTDDRIPGPSNQMRPAAWNEPTKQPPSHGNDSSVKDALSDSSSQVVAVFEQLIRVYQAMAAIDGYMPLSTIERWQEEARMVFGTHATSCIPSIVNGILNVLIPQAIQQNLLKKRYQVETMRRVAISDRKRMEREDEERRRREEEARVAEEARLQREEEEAEEARKRQQEEEQHAKDSVSAEAAASGANDEESSEMVLDDAEGGNRNDAGSDNGSGLHASDQQQQEQQQQQQQPSEPVSINVNGREIDITDTGIDPEFLLALPDELRMEVIEGRREEMRAEQRASGAGALDSGAAGGGDAAQLAGAAEGISQEFLDALPPEIREEVLEQERIQRQLLEREQMLRQRQASAGPMSGATTHNAAASSSSAPHMSTLDSAIRERVRIGVSGTSSGPRYSLFGANASEGARAVEPAEQTRIREKRRKKIASRDIGVQLLSRPELAALTRFIFMPSHALSSSLIVKTIQYICENGRTRSQFIQLILSILDNNATTLADVDVVIRKAIAGSSTPDQQQQGDSSAQVSGGGGAGGTTAAASGASSAAVPKTQQRASASKGAGEILQVAGAVGDQPGSTMLLGTPAVTQFTSSLVQQQSPDFSFPLSELKAEIPAYVPAQRCLDILHSLASLNPRASMHFLTESSSLKSLSVSKTRGSSTGDEDSGGFPVVHLLELLEKPLYYGHGNTITEPLMQLLSTITKPLGTIVRRNQEMSRAQQQQQQDGEGGTSNVAVVDPSSDKQQQQQQRAAVQLPEIPAHALRAIVNVLAAGECTSRTFQHTLSLIQNLSNISGILSIITDELVSRASEISSSLCSEIHMLLDVLKELKPTNRGGPGEGSNSGSGSADDNDTGLSVATAADSAGQKTPAELSTELLDKIRDITLSKFSPASSHQSRLLRLLMAIDYITTTVTKRLEEKQQQQQQQSLGEPSGSGGGGGDMDVDASFSPTTADSQLRAPESSAREAAEDDTSLANELLRLRSLSLSQDSGFLPLWEATSRCLYYTNLSSELAHVATVLLPLIESFMVVFKPVVGEKSKQTSGGESGGSGGGLIPPLSATSATSGMLVSSASTQSLQSLPSATSSGEAYFQNFTEKHKKILNTLVRNNPGLLSGSFSLLVYNPHVLDFDNKRSYFYQRLHDDINSSGASGARRSGAGGGGSRLLGSILRVDVRRENVFEDSFHKFVGKSGDEIRRGRIHVKFFDEEGVDAGGVSREWFQALARQMFNPDYALFKPSASGRVTYQPNPQSWANPDHLLYFKFVGRIIGKAIVDQRVLDAYFTRSFYKHILGRKVDYRDMEAIDPSYYKSLEWILENDITDVFEETFSIEVDNFGQHRVIDLIENGRDVLVAEENKAEYVRLVTEQRLYGAIKDQIKAFLTGFHDVIPKDLISIFNEQELELLISGMPDIDVDDWRNNSEYHGGYNSSTAQIQWFWRAVRSFDQEERAKLLQFVTGTSKVPLEGFAHLHGNQGVQKFQIHKDFTIPTRLPTAHTCFNQLDLPMFDSYESLRSSLLLAISECSTGFGFM
ncbi:E3 ubiquitin-protein ligase tom1 [Coemansia sp. RSA 1285]|nr:E3 ubiquitin-protein ligase tom1 [Coemansia sp. RSA 1285]